MRVHHLNCGTMRPFGGRLVAGDNSIFGAAELVCHCLLIETNAGLVLVDSGIGLADMIDPPGALGRRFVTMNRPALDHDEAAVRQVSRLGYQPDDVRHIVLTHADRDHSGGIRDFPNATVHIYRTELAAALNASNSRDRDRYPRQLWAHQPKWATYTEFGESWFGFDAVRQLTGLPEDILLIPLTGHTAGHAGIAVNTGDKWLLHAGDSYFLRSEIDPNSPRCTPVLRVFQTLVQFDKTQRVDNQRRLRELMRVHGGDIDAFCAHDAAAFHASTSAKVKAN